MTFQTWWLFLVAVFLLSGTPGPNMLHVLSRSVELGVRKTMAAMAGCLTALCLVLIASAVGLTALLLAIPGLFEVLRYAGAAYLLYLGIRAWRAGVPAEDAPHTLSRSISLPRLFRGGFTIGISNPKLLLFAAAFLPQFVNPALPKGPQFAILVLTFATVELFWYFVYALGGKSLSRYLVRPAVRRVFNRVTGCIFIGFGATLLRVRHD